MAQTLQSTSKAAQFKPAAPKAADTKLTKLSLLLKMGSRRK